ncbi:MAG: ABC transporter permease [Actinobacteria bacterium]|nr:ABC transporter permease [Actinomycetota bacterium]
MGAIRREFLKTLFQKRTYIGWAGLFLVPFLITIAFRFSSGGPGSRGGQQDVGEQFFQGIRTNGMYVSIAALLALATFLLPLLSSMSGSYTIAGEAENHTLRSMLMQPIRRGTFLMAKWFAANLYVAIGLVIMGIAALIAGGAVFGLHSITLFSGQDAGIAHALGLIAASYLFVFFAMMAVVSLAVFFSTLTNSSLTAVAAALVLTIIFEALQAFSVFDFLQPYLFTSHFSDWTNLFRSPVTWSPIIKALIDLAVWIVGMSGLAYWRFRRKDILS